MSGCLFFVGDMHLGRRPVGLDDALASCGLEASRLSPARAWALAVEEAIQRGARAVILAGDVVEGEKDRFEGFGHLERGVLRLREAGIPVFGITGNHDALVLPRLASRLGSAFTLLGRGGAWERVEIPGNGPPVDLVGWSFPGRHVLDDPTDYESFAQALDSRRAGARTLGVVHGDLGVPTSTYAPLSRANLNNSPADAWFLGHNHAPDDLNGERPIGYLGSLAGLDPGEPGVHGPWTVTVDGASVCADQVPLAPIRFSNLDVPLDAVGGELDADGVHEEVQGALLNHLAADASLSDPRLQVVVARIRLTGRLEQRAGVHRFVGEHTPERAVFDVGGRPCIVQRVTNATRPAIDLAHLAQQPTPAGYVARMIRQLEEGGGEDLLEKARRCMEPFLSGRWGPPEEHHKPQARRALRAAATRALDVLLQQRDEGEED